MQMVARLYRVGIVDSDEDFTERLELEEAMALMHRYMRRGKGVPYATRVRRPGQTWSRQRFDARQIEQRVRESLPNLDVGDVVVVRRSDGRVIVVRVAKPRPEPKRLFDRVPIPCGGYGDAWGGAPRRPRPPGRRRLRSLRGTDQGALRRHAPLHVPRLERRVCGRHPRRGRPRHRPELSLPANAHSPGRPRQGRRTLRKCRQHGERPAHRRTFALRTPSEPAELRPGRLGEHRGRRVLARRNRMRSLRGAQRRVRKDQWRDPRPRPPLLAAPRLDGIRPRSDALHEMLVRQKRSWIGYASTHTPSPKNAFSAYPGFDRGKDSDIHPTFAPDNVEKPGGLQTEAGALCDPSQGLYLSPGRRACQPSCQHQFPKPGVGGPIPPGAPDLC